MGYEVRNFVKARALYYLKLSLDEHIREPRYNTSWCDVPQIAYWSGTSLASLSILLKRWHKWLYVHARHFSSMVMSDGHAHWLYSLAPSGKTYLERMAYWYPRHKEALNYVGERWRFRFINCGDDSIFDAAPLGVYPIPIRWYVAPSEHLFMLNWPFESEYNVNIADVKNWPEHMRSKGGFYADNLEQAASMASHHYYTKPTQECLRYAKAVELHYVKEALDKLSTAAGLQAASRR